ncbi:selenoprotein Pb-like [Gastrophryne carolinensis]
MHVKRTNYPKRLCNDRSIQPQVPSLSRFSLATRDLNCDKKCIENVGKCIQLFYHSMRGASLILLLELVASVYSAKKETAICKPPPDWSIGDEAPMRDSYSQVTVVALLQASCGFCLVQAQNMGPLRDKLANQGLTNISYIIVNDQSPMSKLLFPELKRRAPPGIPVYQQLPNQEDVWQLLDGNKDDFLIYDRCGRLTFHIRLPLSFLHFPYVEAAINATFYEDYCQNCSFYANVSYDATVTAHLPVHS